MIRVALVALLFIPLVMGGGGGLGGINGNPRSPSWTGQGTQEEVGGIAAGQSVKCKRGMHWSALRGRCINNFSEDAAETETSVGRMGTWWGNPYHGFGPVYCGTEYCQHYGDCRSAHSELGGDKDVGDLTGCPNGYKQKEAATCGQSTGFPFYTMQWLRECELDRAEEEVGGIAGGQSVKCKRGMHWSALRGTCINNFSEDAAEEAVGSIAAGQSVKCKRGMHWSALQGRCIGRFSEDAAATLIVQDTGSHGAGHLLHLVMTGFAFIGFGVLMWGTYKGAKALCVDTMQAL